MQHEARKECGPDGNRRNQQAGGAGRDARFSVVQRNVVERNADRPGENQSRDVAPLRTAKMRDAGVDRKHERSHQKTQDREMSRRVCAETGANPREGRCPQGQGDSECDESTTCKARHREILNIGETRFSNWMRRGNGGYGLPAISASKRRPLVVLSPEHRDLAHVIAVVCHNLFQDRARC